MGPDGSVGVGDASLSESTVEAVALDWLAALGWAVAHGPDIAPDTPAAERADYGAVVLTNRLRSALAHLNPDLPDGAFEDALRRLMSPAGATLEARNRDFHRMVVAGVTVEYVDTDGRVRGDQVRVLDFDEPEANDWLAVNQFTVVENRHERRPDIVLFVNSSLSPGGSWTEVIEDDQKLRRCRYQALVGRRDSVTPSCTHWTLEASVLRATCSRNIHRTTLTNLYCCTRAGFASVGVITSPRDPDQLG